VLSQQQQRTWRIWRARCAARTGVGGRRKFVSHQDKVMRHSKRPPEETHTPASATAPRRLALAACGTACLCIHTGSGTRISEAHGDFRATQPRRAHARLRYCETTSTRAGMVWPDRRQRTLPVAGTHSSQLRCAASSSRSASSPPGADIVPASQCRAGTAAAAGCALECTPQVAQLGLLAHALTAA
jgi:hypothetical protein